MKLEDIIKICEEYLKIDETKLDKESIEIPSIYGKILRIRMNESLLLQKYRNDLKKLYSEKKEYYLGRADPKVYKEKPFDLKILKSEVDSYIESDDDFLNLKTKIDIQEEKIFYLDNILKQINNKGFLIKNALEFQKLINGIN